MKGHRSSYKNICNNLTEMIEKCLKYDNSQKLIDLKNEKYEIL